MQKKIVLGANKKNNRQHTQYKFREVDISMSISKSVKYSMHYVLRYIIDHK